MVLRMLRVAIPPGSLDDGHETEALALLHAVGGWQAYSRTVRHAPTAGPVVRFLLFDYGYPGSVASSVEALRRRCSGSTHSRFLAAGAPAGPADRRPRAPAAAPDAGAPRHTLERVQHELELVDRDIDARYFAIAALAAVHL